MMVRKIIVAVFIMSFVSAFLFTPPVNSEEITIVQNESKADSCETAINLSPEDLTQCDVVEETPRKKTKNLLPFLLFAGGAYLALDSVHSPSNNGYSPLVEGDEFFSSLNLRPLERKPDVNIMITSRRQKYQMGDDVNLHVNNLDNSVGRHLDAESRGFTWSGDNLIGRLNPVFVSVKSADDDTINVLIAGLNNLIDGQMARIELYDTETMYIIEVNNTDGDNFGVFRTIADLDVNSVYLSIDLMQ